MAPDDATALLGFFSGVPEGDRTFFRDDVLDPATIDRWLADPSQRRLGAMIDGEIVGHVAVIPGMAWSRHVGEVRLVVAPDHRRRGVGRLLAQRGVVEAAELGVTKLVVEVVAEQQATVAMFTALGFEAEGLLKGHVRSRSGETRDLLVLAHWVDRLWPIISAAGIDDAQTS